MVSLINHEYSRREAHGRLAWQSMPSNVRDRRLPPTETFRVQSKLQAGGHTVQRVVSRALVPATRRTHTQGFESLGSACPAPESSSAVVRL